MSGIGGFVLARFVFFGLPFLVSSLFYIPSGFLTRARLLRGKVDVDHSILYSCEHHASVSLIP